MANGNKKPIKTAERRRAHLERLLWGHTHPNYRGKGEDGVKRVLHLVPGQGTCSWPLSSFTDAQIEAKIPRVAREWLAIWDTKNPPADRKVAS